MIKADDMFPRWQRELDNFKGIKSTFIIEGNINDEYPSVNLEKGIVSFCGINQILYRIFNTGYTEEYYDYLFCDPLFGFNNPIDYQEGSMERLIRISENFIKNREEFQNRVFKSQKNKNYNDSLFIYLSEIVRELMTQALPEENAKKSIAVVMNYASRYIPSPEGLSMDDTAFFLNLLYASKNAIRGNRYINTLILLVDKFNDIPAWFYIGNPNVRTITIPNPERVIREAYIRARFGADITGNSLPPIMEKFVDLTDGMKLLEIDEIRRLNKNIGYAINDIDKAVSIYKYGIKDDPWKKAKKKIVGIDEVLRVRVKGQETAISKIIGTLKRAATGLAGMQHSSRAQKPRGIFFLAGPTGTGKTEVVKALAERIFGDEKAILRFDMSEYREAHSDQKLFGAPPGYIGYDNGGQLTNAVRSNPFSILLFDEIEKAHPTIMDKFLQILEDGRMTDGQGNTVFFSETLIFFTSNIGISKEIIVDGKVIEIKFLVNPGDPYEKICKSVDYEMENTFKPELINRIGKNNVIVFDFIGVNEVKLIIDRQIESIHQNVFNDMGIKILKAKETLEYIEHICQSKDIRSYGGRGIGNIIEEQYLTPLSDYIFERDLNGKSICSKVVRNKIVFSEV